MSNASDDEFRPKKKPRLILSAPKPPATTQEVPATTQRRAQKATRKSRKTVTKATLSPAAVTPKAEPHGEPPVWAEGRQALCSTVHYYNSYQSGLYHLGGIVYAGMMDKNGGSGAYLDNEVVITRAGGGSGKKDEEGNNAPTQNQDETKATVKALINTMQKRIPVVLILGKDNQEVSVVLKHMYSVMDYFIITNVWFEKSAGVSFCKVRFEKRDLATISWWAPRDSPSPLPADQRDYSTKAEAKMCASCGKESVKIYAEAWMCLVTSCNSFWTVEGGPPPSTLTYNPAFLDERCEKSDLRRPPFALKPPLPQKGKMEVGTQGVSEDAMGGIACPRCGRCTSRALWDGWCCETDGCGFNHMVKPPLVPAAQVTRPQQRFDGHAPCDTITENLDIDSNVLKEYRKDVITVCPGNNVTHFAANNVINSRPGGTDDMFEELQQANIGLKRSAMNNSPLKGPTLTRHFTKNYGMPYKYIVAQSSEPFKTAPPVILKFLAQLIWAGEQSIQDGSQKPFNEVLVLGYMESGAIGFHDDGENTLGPTIATISLGCSAVMRIRMKWPFYYGQSKKGIILADDPVLPGCRNYEERLKLKNLRGTMNSDEFKKLEAEVYALPPDQKREPPACITLHLKHGDIVVMHGADIQKYYEHNVIPDGKMRFAITSRHIIPDKIERAHHHMGEFEIAPEDAYNGD